MHFRIWLVDSWVGGHAQKKKLHSIEVPMVSVCFSLASFGLRTSFCERNWGRRRSISSEMTKPLANFES